MKLCSRCRVAEYGEGDRFCIWCGDPLRKLEVVLSREAVVVAAGEDAREAWADGELRNVGQLGDRARVLAPELPWLKITDAEGGEPPAEGWVLAPRTAVPFRVRIQPREALSGISAARLHARSELDTAPRDDDAASVELRVYPQPVLRAAWREGTALWMDEEPAPELVAEVRIESAAETRLERVSAEAPWAEPRVVPSGRPAELRVKVDVPALKRTLEAERPPQVELRLSLVTAEPAQTIPVSLSVPLRWPAELRPEGVHGTALGDDLWQWTLPPGRAHLLSLLLRNPGGRPVAVHDVTLEAADGRLLWTGVKPTPERPLVVEGGKQIGRLIAADLRPTQTAGAKEESVEAVRGVVTFHTTTPGFETVPVTLEVRAGAYPDFKGAVGLDFGTTNSCIAFWEALTPEPRVGALLGGFRFAGEDLPSPRAVLSSNVLYRQRVSDEIRGSETGVDLAGYAKEPDKDVSRVVRSAKRYLGSDETFHVRYDDGAREALTPARIVGDVVSRLLGDAEQVLRRRIRRCAITHPVRFSTRQLNLLRELVEAAGVEVGRVMPEPVAAAVSFAVFHAGALEPELPPEYDLLVFDIGGGTTDLALVHVKTTDTGKGPRVIHPSLRAIHGLRWAGGDDVTWAQISQLLYPDPQSAALDDKWIGDAFGLEPAQIPQMRAALAEEPVLRIAEDKLLLRSFAIAEDEKLNRSTVSGAAPSPNRLFPSEVERDRVTDAFLAKNGLIELAQLTAKQGGAEHPDVVLLVGQSWRIPLLVERAVAAFPHSRVVLPGESGGADQLKEVVAQGVCAAEMIRTQTMGLRLELEELPAIATSNVGIAKGDRRTGRLVFSPVIAANEPLGGWHLVEGVELTRNGRIDILENTGNSPELVILRNGRRQRNPEISQVGVAYLAERITEAEIDDEVLNREGELLMRLTERHEVELKVKVGSQAWPFVFERPPLT